MASLCKGLNKLAVVQISLDQKHDRPQLIYESMNDTGLDMSTADKIRNFVLLDMTPEDQEKFYRDHWRAMEDDFGQADSLEFVKYFGEFTRYYLAHKNRQLPDKDKVYAEFKTYAHAQQSEAGTTDVLPIVEDIKKFARYYCAMKFGLSSWPDRPFQEKNPLLKMAFDDLQEINANTPFPLLLELYDDYITFSNILSRASSAQLDDVRRHFLDYLHSAEQFEEIIRMIESYIVRRSVCRLPPPQLADVFALFGKYLEKERCVESIRDHFLSLTGIRAFPRDSEFQTEFIEGDPAGRPICKYIFRRMENHGRRSRFPLDDYNVEYIMPQKRPLSDDWKRELGEDWSNIQERWAKTPGNLTLMEDFRDSAPLPFSRKRDVNNGYRNSPLLLTKELGSVQRWDANAIRKRAERLAQRALEVWPMP